MSAIGGVPRIPPGPVAARNASARRAMSMMFVPSLTVMAARPERMSLTWSCGRSTIDGSNIIDMARLALAFRAATGPGGIRGTPPIADINYQPGGVGSTVLLDPEATPAFWTGIRDGTLPPGTVGGMPQLG